MQKIWKFVRSTWGVRILLILFAAVIIAEGMYINYATGGSTFSFLKQDSTCEMAVSRWERENPEWAKPRDLFTGAPAKTHIKDSFYIHAKDFESDIMKAVERGPNFSGHYAVAQWSCGTTCQRHAVVDLTSGLIVAFGIPSEAGVSTSEQYSVLITNPAANLPSAADLQKANPQALAYLLNLPREYYVLEERGATTTLKKICSENPFEGMGI